MSSQEISVIAACVSFVSAVVTLSVNHFISNRKELNQLRVICRILLSESEHNKVLLCGLANKELLSKEFVKSKQMDADWSLLKKESAFYKMNDEDFEVLIDYYRRLPGLQRSIREPQMSDGETTITNMDDIPDFALKPLIEDCEKACVILTKYAKKDSLKKKQ